MTVLAFPEPETSFQRALRKAADDKASHAARMADQVRQDAQRTVPMAAADIQRERAEGLHGSRWRPDMRYGGSVVGVVDEARVEARARRDWWKDPDLWKQGRPRSFGGRVSSDFLILSATLPSPEWRAIARVLLLAKLAAKQSEQVAISQAA